MATTLEQRETQDQGPGQGGIPGQTSPAPPAKPASEVQVPKIKFFDVEISRMVLGVNPFYGYAHYNTTLGAIMREYYTAERVCEVMHQCNRFGINASRLQN